MVSIASVVMWCWVTTRNGIRHAGSEIRANWRELMREMFGSPFWPILFWGETIKSVMTGGPWQRLVQAAVGVTFLWVTAALWKYAAASAAEEVAD